MSNRVALQFTKFVDVDEHGNEMETHWGYRIYDDYEGDYNNFFSGPEELREAINERTILRYIWENHDSFWLAVENRGLYFNGSWYTFKELIKVADEETREILGC